MSDQRSNGGSHHVAWADRLGLNKIWHDQIDRCRLSYGTEDFRKDVFCLHNLIINIKDGPALHDIISHYIDGPWRKIINEKLGKWISQNISDAEDMQIVQSEEEKLEEDHLKDILLFMIQTLEDNGFGFYKSDVSVDEISLTQKSQPENDESTEGY